MGSNSPQADGRNCVVLYTMRPRHTLGWMACVLGAALLLSLGHLAGGQTLASDLCTIPRHPGLTQDEFAAYVRALLPLPFCEVV